MKRIISMLLVCLMLVQMLPLGIHTHAHETETHVEETVAVETTEVIETTPAPETTETVAETEAAEVEETEVLVEETVAAELLVTEDGETVLDLSEYENRAATIRVGVENVNGEWVMTSAEEVELPEGFDISRLDDASAMDVGDNLYNEKESNNSQSYANIVYDDYTVQGTLSSSDLMDWFTFYLNSKSDVIIVAVAKYSSFMMGVYDSSNNILGADTSGEYSSGNYTYNLYGTLSSGRKYLCFLDDYGSYNSYLFYITITPVPSSCSHSSYTSVVTAPTCGAQGYTTYTCKSCSYTWKGSFTDPTGNHTYTDSSDTTCNVCGATRETGVASGYCGSSLKWVLDEEGTLTITGTGSMYNYDNYSYEMPWEPYDKDIKKVVIESGATSIGSYAFYFCTNITSVTIPSTVTAIKDNAFYHCDSLKNVTLPNNLKSIGESAFQFCDSLTSITIPDYVSSIGALAFQGCSKLKGIWVNSGNSYYSSDSKGVLYNYSKTIVYVAPETITGSYEIPYGVKEIYKSAFYSCDEMTGITIPDTVTTIGSSAFAHCQKIKTVVIPDGVKVLNGYTFNSCYDLTSITLPKNLTTLDSHELSFTGLKNVTIPSTVTSIGGYAFSSCDDLSKITFLGNAPTFKDTSFNNITATAYYPAGNSTWTSAKRQNYGGTISWVATCTNHNVVTMPAVEPTCTQPGKTEGSYCSLCNEILVQQTTIDALGHNEVTIPAVVPTCTETGLSEGKKCSRCDKVLVAQLVLSALGHDTVTKPAVAPTCTQPGKTEGSYCARCDVILVAQQTVPSLGHNAATAPAVAPTCTQPGKTEGSYCTRCNDTLVAQETIPALGHVEVVDTGYAATCTTDGLTDGKHCSRCNSTLVAQQTIPALGHNEIIDSAAVEPTCTETGLTKASHCARCNTVLAVQDILPALGHEEAADAAVAPDCVNTGLTAGSHCARCNIVLVAQEVIPALGHTVVVDAAVAPACEQTGLTEGSHCSVCNTVLVAQEVIPALGHSYQDHFCTTCGQTEFVEVISIESDTTSITAGEQANLTAILDYPIRENTEIVWTLAEGDEAYATLTADRETAVLTAKSAMEDATVTVSAKTADGLNAAVSKQITVRAVEADYQLFAGKTLTLKPMNPATGKAYTAKQLTWSMASEFEPFVKMANGKVTAQKVVEKARVEVKATVVATGEVLSYVIDVYPVITQAEVKKGEEVVNGKTILMDFDDASLTLTAEAFPVDTLKKVTWTVSDKKGQYADYQIGEDTLTITNPRGKAGTVTIKATVDAGVKKNVTVKVQFASFAKTVEIFEPEKTTLRGGESMTLSGYISDPIGVTQPALVWTTSNKLAATVSNGKVTAKNVAHPTLVTITATSKDGQASASVQLKIVPKNEGQLVLMQDGAYVTNSTIALNFGDTRQLSASIVENGQPAAVDATWTSSKATVAHVADGLIRATGVGSAKITAEYNGMKAVINVKVSTLVADMEITTKDGKNLIREGEETLVILSSGKNVALVANILTAGANKAVDWAITEGAEYAKIASGKVTANKDLTKPVYVTVKATAKDGSGVSASIRVKIVPLATGVQIYESGSRVRSNTTYTVDISTESVVKLNAKVYPAKANQAVELTSSNKKVADFNENGELICYKTGSVTITAKALDGSNVKTTFKLNVVKKITKLELAKNIPVDKNGNIYVQGGKSLKLAPMVQINPTDATNKKLNWSVSSNEFGIKISTAGVLSTKKVPYPVTVNIMVTSQDGSGQMLSFNVTVYPG